MMSISAPATPGTLDPIPASAEPPSQPPVHARIRREAARRYLLLTNTAIAARGTAALRIGYGSLWVLFLLREWPERDVAWGPSSPWTAALDRQYSGWPTSNAVNGTYNST